MLTKIFFGTLAAFLLTSTRLYGQIDFTTATVQIEPVYLGQKLNSLGATFSMMVVRDGSTNYYFNNGSGTQSESQTYQISPGSHTFYVRDQAGYTSGGFMTVNIPPGTTTIVQVETSSAFGLIKGIVQDNGGPLAANNFRVCGHDVGYNCFGFSGYLSPGGNFRSLVPTQGLNYTARGKIFRDNPSATNEFSYSPVAGQEVDLGILNFRLGTVQIEPVYLGQKLNSLGAAFSVMVVRDGSTNYYFTNGSGTQSESQTYQISPGSHTFYVRDQAGYTSGGFMTVNIPAGVTTVVKVEMSSAFGLIRGVVRENGGQLTPNNFRVCGHDVGWNCFAITGYLPPAGNFRIVVPTQGASYMARGTIWRDNPSATNQFTYRPIAGKEVDLGSPGSLQFTGNLTRSGTNADARTWSMALTNNNTATLLDVKVTGFSVTQSGGTTCASLPVLTTTLPVSYGDFNAGQTKSQPFVWDFSGCPDTDVRFTFTATVSAVGQTQTISKTQQVK